MQNVTSVSIECTLGYQKVNQARSGWPTSTARARDRAAVADQADDDGAVDDGAQFLEFQDVEQEAGEEGAGAEGDHGEIEEDPQAEGEAVVHVGLVQAFDQAEAGGVEAEGEQRDPGQRSTTGTARWSSACTPRVMKSLSTVATPSPLRDAAHSANSRTHSLFRPVVDLGIGAERFEQAEAVGLLRARATSLAASFRLPKRMAPVGQASAQAGM